VLTGFLYVFSLEKSSMILEEICGARLTTNMGRIGGFEEIGHQKLLES
jgi:NADH-quinone oxidoreductase subunit D